MRKTLLIVSLILLPSYLAAACASGTPLRRLRSGEGRQRSGAVRGGHARADQLF